MNIIKGTVYPTEDVRDFNLLPNGYCRVNEINAEKMLNSPVPTGMYFNGQVFTHNDGRGYTTQIAVNNRGSIYYRDNSVNSIWTIWKEFATVSPATAYNLPLASGYKSAGGLNHYYKTPNNLVVVNISMMRSDAAAWGLGAFTIATLPEGFRPAANAHNAIPYSNDIVSSGTPYCDGAARVYVIPNGEIRIISRVTTLKEVDGSIVFISK
ncbi:hypothetical protein [Harryflintia acetispora]|uniref:hypothetical protein n=1 Tax=Harryflintia acetispora TaxID=1849041 RepID=UPI001899820D|nr:hypothetical protein [Harryflintia acetispora]